jgi:hypothetical protein
MQYQLVLQFPEDALNFDQMVALEDWLIDKTSGIADVDGHDMGVGEINLFIVTDRPTEVFDSIYASLDVRYKSILKAAYRAMSSNEYTVIWPPTLNNFYVG